MADEGIRITGPESITVGDKEFCTGMENIDSVNTYSHNIDLSELLHVDDLEEIFGTREVTIFTRRATIFADNEWKILITWGTGSHSYNSTAVTLDKFLEASPTAEMSAIYNDIYLDLNELTPGADINTLSHVPAAEIKNIIDNITTLPHAGIITLAYGLDPALQADDADNSPDTSEDLPDKDF